jgi:hypothetical protein
MYMDIDNRFLTGYEVGNPPRRGLSGHKAKEVTASNFGIIYRKQHKCLCGNCLQEFQGKKGQKFCSKDCRWNYHLVKQKLSTRIDRTCPVCGVVFKTKHLNQKFCTPSCRIGSHKKTFLKSCPVCGQNFEVYNNRTIYCSDKCKRKKKNTKNRSFIKKVGECEVCGFKLLVALEAHHYSEKERIVLCGNCHNIWHQTSKERFALKEAVISVIRGVRQEYSRLPLQCALESKKGLNFRGVGNSFG